MLATSLIGRKTSGGTIVAAWTDREQMYVAVEHIGCSLSMYGLGQVILDPEPEPSAAELGVDWAEVEPEKDGPG